MHVVRVYCGRLWAASLFALLAFVIAQGEAAPLDGPYAVHEPDGTVLARWVEEDEAAPRIRQERVSIGQHIVVPAVGSLPAIRVRVRPSAAIAPDRIALPPETPLFVIADTHGEYEIVVELLRKHRIVDSSLRWSFGSGRLVILGDVFDRGPNQLEILWLLYELEAQAAREGGGVHLVLGNHEIMVLTGDQRYLNEKYVQTAQVLGAGSYSELFSSRTVLGQWLRTKPAVLKIGNLLCLHGGISRDVVERELTLQQLNTTVRDTLNDKELKQADQDAAKLITGRLGPLWYRGYFADQKDFPTATPADIDRVRDVFGVTTIFVGHTVVPTITPLYDGKVIAVQVYPRRDLQSGQATMEGVLIQGGKLFRASIAGTTEPLH